MKYILNRLKKLYDQRHELKQQAMWLKECSGRELTKLVGLFLLDVLISVITVGSTLLNKRLIDGASVHGSFRGLVYLLLVTLTLLNIGVSAGVRYVTQILQERMSFTVRENVFRHVLRARFQTVTARHSGDTLTRMTSDVDTVASGITQLIPNFLNLAVRMVLAFAVLYSFDRLLALAALVLGPIVVLVGLMFSGKLKYYQEKIKENESEYRSFMQESSERILVIKTFGKEEEYVKRLGEIRGERMRMIRKRGKVNMMMRVSMNLVFSSGYLLAFGWGIRQIAVGAITYGTMSVFLSLVSQVQGPIASMGNIIPSIINVLASAGRVMEVLSAESETREDAQALRGSVGVRFSHVEFLYDGDEEPVLRDVCMDIAPGETVGLIGETGAGKTTLVKLLLSVVKQQKGRVEVYDAEGNTETVSATARRLFAYVPQGNTLSSGTLRRNIVMGDAVVPDEKLWEVLRMAEAEAFVRELPNGLDTRIGESGLGLSEGQAQRIAIARALLRNAPLLILDEASASLDMETEKRIMQNLKRCTAERTCLIITHRPSLLELCDRCYKVADSKVSAV